MVRAFTLVGVFLLSLVSQPAFASSILFQQSMSSGPMRNSTHDPSVASSGFSTFDNFSLGTDALIESVTFYGIYWDFVTRSANPILPNTNDWRLRVTADQPLLPGSTLHEELHPANAATVTTTFLGFTGFNIGGQTDTVPLYSVTISLVNPFLAQAETTYWFGALSEVSPYDGRIFAWWPSEQADSAAQWNFGTGAYTSVRDVAFELNGTPVPEPGSLVLLGTALAAASRFRKRTR